jgi:hypothetical protein
LRSLPELAAAIASEEAGPLDKAVVRRTDLLKLTDDQLLNPSHWPTL